MADLQDLKHFPVSLNPDLLAQMASTNLINFIYLFGGYMEIIRNVPVCGYDQPLEHWLIVH